MKYGTIFSRLLRQHIPPKKQISNIYAYLQDLSVQKNKVVFFAERSSYGNDLKYIAEEIIRQQIPCELVWIADKDILHFINSFPSNIRLVMQGTDEALEEFASAKVWIGNTWRNKVLQKVMRKKNCQLYIQTWYGSFEIHANKLETFQLCPKKLKLMMNDARQVDYFITNSKLETEFYKRVLAATNVQELGSPRSDVFFQSNLSVLKTSVKRKLGISEGVKLLLYVPQRWGKRTMRDTVQWDEIKLMLHNKFEGEWEVVYYNTHQDYVSAPISSQENIFDAYDYPDLQELLVSADVLITNDYSCLSDFILTGKPCFVYESESSDGIQMNTEDTEEVSIPVATTAISLLSCIKNFDYNSYVDSVLSLKNKWGVSEEENSARRVVELIKQVVA